MNFQNFKFDDIDIIPADVKNISLLAFFAYFLLLMICRKNLLQSLMIFLTIFQELVKLGGFVGLIFVFM